MKQMVCLTHGAVPDYYQWLAPLGGASTMGTFAYHLSKGNPYATLGGILAGLWTGTEAAKRCPQCGALLQIVEDINPFFG